MSALAAPHGARAVKAGVAYFAIVFAVGFVLGTLRTLFLVPRIGPLAAVLVELPVLLPVAWMVCRWLVRRCGVGTAWTERLLMGVVAFVLLMVAELTISVAAFGGTVEGFLAALATSQGAVGLAGQVIFAALPLVSMRR